MRSPRRKSLESRLLAGAVGLIFGVLQGCASGPKPQGPAAISVPAAAPVAGGEDYGPAAPNGSSPQAAVPGGPPDGATPGSGQPYGPAPVELRPLTLVFGPGLARDYADVGSLRTLVHSRVPITAVYGSGLGSLFAAVYAMDPNLNHFEWSILKFKDDLFAPESQTMLRRFFRSEAASSRLEAALIRAFGSKDISDAKVPLRIAIQREGERIPTLVTSGRIVPALMAALAEPGVFEPANWEGHTAQAVQSPAGAAYLCDDAKARGGSPVVLVDAQGMQDEVRNADVVIRPELSGILDWDFGKKSEAAFRGKRATESKLAEIRRWVGLPAANQE